MTKLKVTSVQEDALQNFANQMREVADIRREAGDHCHAQDADRVASLFEAAINFIKNA